MGYALEYAEFIDNNALNVDTSYIEGASIFEIGYYYRTLFDDWMYDSAHLGPGNFEYIATYYSGIYENWFSVFYVVNFADEDNNGVYSAGEPIGYHWYYQTSAGFWAGKTGSFPSVAITNTIDQGPLNQWLKGCSEKIKYSYGYYQIRDIRNVSW